MGPDPRIGMGAGSPGLGGLGEALFDRRVVQIAGRLDDSTAAEIAARLMTLDALGDEPIELIVDSSDGTLDAALAVADTIDLLGVPTHALCIGRAEGPAVLVLAVAEHREVAPRARLRMSAPSASIEAPIRDVDMSVQRHRDRLDRFVVRLAQATGRRIESVREDVLAGRSFDAEEAVAYGLADEVRRPRGVRPSNQ
jgi:ATP-dependent Clp protease, protease subunit